MFLAEWRIGQTSVVPKQLDKENKQPQPQKKRKFLDNQASEETQGLLDEFLEPKPSSLKSLTSKKSDTVTLADIYKIARKTREDVALIKNVLLSEKKDDDQWEIIRRDFPFTLPLNTEVEVETCEQFINGSEDNKDKLVRKFFVCFWIQQNSSLT